MRDVLLKRVRPLVERLAAGGDIGYGGDLGDVEELNFGDGG